MYKVIFTRRALKDWENLDKEIRDRIAAKLKEYSKNPFKYARKLIHPKIGTYRFRIGDWRVIFDIDERKYSNPESRAQKRYLQMNTTNSIKFYNYIKIIPCFYFISFIRTKYLNLVERKRRVNTGK